MHTVDAFSLCMEYSENLQHSVQYTAGHIELGTVSHNFRFECDKWIRSMFIIIYQNYNSSTVVIKIIQPPLQI